MLSPSKIEKALRFFYCLIIYLISTYVCSKVPLTKFKNSELPSSASADAAVWCVLVVVVAVVV